MTRYVFSFPDGTRGRKSSKLDVEVAVAVCYQRKDRWLAREMIDPCKRMPDWVQDGLQTGKVQLVLAERYDAT